jgi:hypothetical protein
MIEDPRLAGDRLDHVVAVEALIGVEVVIGAARAASPSHRHVDDREAEQVGELRDPADRTGRVGVAVTRVLDQRRVGLGDPDDRRVLGQGSAAQQRRGVDGVGKVDVDRELRSVARGQVPVARADPLVVDRRRGRRL